MISSAKDRKRKTANGRFSFNAIKWSSFYQVKVIHLFWTGNEVEFGKERMYWYGIARLRWDYAGAKYAIGNTVF